MRQGQEEEEYGPINSAASYIPVVNDNEELNPRRFRNNCSCICNFFAAIFTICSWIGKGILANCSWIYKRICTIGAWKSIAFSVIIGVAAHLYIWATNSQRNWFDLVGLSIIIGLILALKCAEKKSNNHVRITTLTYPYFENELNLTFGLPEDEEKFSASKFKPVKEEITRILHQPLFERRPYIKNPIIFLLIIHCAMYISGFCIGLPITIPLTFLINSVFLQYSLILRWRLELVKGIREFYKTKGHHELCKKEDLETPEIWCQFRRIAMDLLRPEFSVLSFMMKIVVVSYALKSIRLWFNVFMPQKETCEDDIVRLLAYDAFVWITQYILLIWIVYLESRLKETYSDDLDLLTGPGMGSKYNDMIFQLAIEQENNPLSKNWSFLLQIVSFSGILAPVIQFVYDQYNKQHITP